MDGATRRTPISRRETQHDSAGRLGLLERSSANGKGLRDDAASIELTVVVPTFNEIDNVKRLHGRLMLTLSGIAWEVIFVDDDSPDGTADMVRRLAREHGNVRCLQRIGRRGLSSACVEGALASAARYVAVIDADMQHDETLLPAMLDVLRADEADVVIGSRYVEGAGTGDWNTKRVWISAGATHLARLLIGNHVADPLSGFFMAPARVWHTRAPYLSVLGYKILMDILLPPPHGDLRVRELPYTFRDREIGQSKLSRAVAWDFLLLLVDKKIGRYVPVQLVSFCLIGLSGACVHMAVLSVGWALGLTFVTTHAAATAVAMTSNFLLNNTLTYRDRMLRGWRMAAGWLSFCLASSVGVVGNIGAAYWLQESEHGWTVSALAGVLIGTVWNYVTTRSTTWRT